MRYKLFADGEDWRSSDHFTELVDYAKWLVEMPWHEPEAKASVSTVVDTQTGEVIYDGKRTDHRPFRGNWTWVDPKCEIANEAGRGRFTAPIGRQRRFARMLTPFFLLVVIALLLSIASLVFPKPFLGPIALVLICIALLIPR